MSKIRISETKNSENIQRFINGFKLLLSSKNPYQDLLGNIYMQLEISNKNAGQFFTPYNISQASAKVAISKPMLSKQVHDKGYVSVNDPSVGAGGMLIAAAEICNDLFKRLNYKNHVYFVGQDIDITCCHMSYIQISLLGLAGYIIHANTLTTPVVDYFKDNSLIWTTPYYNMDIWQGRILFHKLGMLMQERKVDNV